ncbi:MAG TPA: SURF1 family protein [Gammaproteobacteria bacterium]|jgi:surfeit locus 1 family protein|nr:SURF1 family protein [Gammaproteobacteria bacterium]
MKMTIKNWKLSLLSMVFIVLFTSLGFWQLNRAHEKTEILNNYESRAKIGPLSSKDLKTPNDWRFYQVKLVGKFDDSHTILLDNKIFNGKIGYEVYTPFTAQGMDSPILVDRGFIPMGVSREALPAIPKTAKGTVTIQGMLNTPPTYVSLGSSMSDGPKIEWPLRVEYIHLPQISKLLKDSFYPYIISLNPESPSALQVKWQIVNIDPNKHKGYAVQWFALALTLLIISVVLNRTPGKKRGRSRS